MSKEVIVKLPEELLPYLGVSEQEIGDHLKQAAVLELLRQKKISQGKAAELLGLTRWDLFELMSKHSIPHADFSLEELDQEIEESEKKQARKP